MTSFLVLSVLSAVLYFIYSAHCLVKNVRAVQRTGLPYVVLPTVFWNNFHGFLFSTRSFRFIVNNWLPHSLADHVNDTHSVGRWRIKDRMVQKVGGCFLRASPAGVAFNVGDANVARQIVTNRHEFPKPLHQYGLLKIYGPNIVASGGKDWARHRHHSAPAFNEKNNLLVWGDALAQATGMLVELRGGPDTDPESDFVVERTQSYIGKVILQVLASAGFGVSLPYTSTSKSSDNNTKSIFEDSATPPPGYSASFRAVLQYMSVNFRSVVLALAVMPKWIPPSLQPFLKPEVESYRDLGNYLNSLIDMANVNDAEGRGSNNLLQLLVRSNEQKESNKDYRLTPKELLGNVHIFTVAGFETTATTLRFTLVLLALYPEAQRWLRQGIKEALAGQSENPQEWSYTEVFPKLISPLCVMMETMRLCPAVVTVPKWTGAGTPDIEYNGKTYTLPPNTNINLNTSSLHYRSEYWGPDVHSFVPQRWDARNKDSFLAQNEGVEGLAAPGLEHPTLHKPVRGAYMPFSDGNRSCLGKKFAQVEYVAVLAVIFRDYEVSLAKVSPGESEEETVKRAWRVLNNSWTILALVMDGDVPLSFRKNRV